MINKLCTLFFVSLISFASFSTISAEITSKPAHVFERAISHKNPVIHPTADNVNEALAMLEMSSGGKLGLSAINTGNHQRIRYHARQRFPMACTSKVIGVAAILKKSMQDKMLLQETIHYTKHDLTHWTPITAKHLADGMTVEALSAAAISYSDNTAMNLLLKKLGGMKSLNAFAHSIGDESFKLDHRWPDEAHGNLVNNDDSTTPAAMEKTLQKLLLGNDVLAPMQRKRLLTWMQDNVIGNARIRAGAPKGWRVCNKTGTGFHYGTTNDIAVLWPPKCAPIVIIIYYSHLQKDAPKREDVLAKATRIVLREFALHDKCLSFDTVNPRKD